MFGRYKKRHINGICLFFLLDILLRDVDTLDVFGGKRVERRLLYSMFIVYL